MVLCTTAHATERARVVLSYERSDVAKKACPDESTFRALVAARLGYDPVASEAPLALRVELRPRGGGITGNLELTSNGAAKGRRSMNAAPGDCYELAASLALAAAVAVDPEGAHAQSTATEPALPRPPSRSPWRDVADRTGTIVFDAEGHNVGLQGWISVEITEDPAPAPSFTLQQNFENGSIPRNAVEIHFAQICGGDNVGISQLFVYDDYHQNLVLSDSAVCAPAGAGKLNHFEVKLSKSHIEVHATPASSDGVTFGNAVLLGSKDVALPFTRGYVHLTTHNHASLKYSNETVDAWTARWDNVGFDGPAIVGGFREYEALDPLTATNGGKVNVGWRVAKDADGPAQRIEIKGVDVTGAIRARLALQNWSYHPAESPALADYALNYRLNGRGWKKRPLTAAEQRMMTELPNAGTRSLMLDVDVADLVDGTNTVEFTTTNALPPLAPVVVNIDLLVETG